MSSAQKRLKVVIDQDLCSGCGLCESIAGDGMAMTYNEAGYLRPKTATAPDEEIAAEILTCCPGNGVRLPPETGEQHALWGPLISSHTAFATDQELAHKGSSGGALSGFLLAMLRAGEADQVLHIAADADIPVQNKLQVSTGKAAIMTAAGSRYAPSSPLSRLKEITQANKRTILVGKPCDIAAARQYLEQDPERYERVPMLVSFMCGGIPSQKGTSDILEHLGVEESDLVSFRYRGEGWPGHVQAKRKDGTIESMTYHDSWGGILSSQVQFRCKICPDGTGYSADIVFADAWYGDERGWPKFDEAEGRSMVLVRTEKGAAMFAKAVAASDVEASPLDITEVEKMQPFQAKRKRLTLSRVLALRLLMRRTPKYGNIQLRRAAASAGVWPNLKSFLGMARRILLKRQ